MNDFTKDELKIIFLEINIAISNWGEDEYKDYPKLKSKIQSMIDNYCDNQCSHHEPIRLRLLSQKDYDFCETCLYVRRIR
jgi:hypothetical protein